MLMVAHLAIWHQVQESRIVNSNSSGGPIEDVNGPWNQNEEYLRFTINITTVIIIMTTIVIVVIVAIIILYNVYIYIYIQRRS